MYNLYFKTDARSYLTAFGKLKFQNELYELRRKLSPEWYAKLDEIEEAVIYLKRNQIDGSNVNTKVNKNIDIFNIYVYIEIMERNKCSHIAGFNCNMFRV